MPITTPKLKQAMQNLAILHPFWATLALHMEFVERQDIDTFATNGKKIFFNPKFSESLSVGVNMFVIAHESAHPMLHHLTRRLQPRPGDVRVYGHDEKGRPFYWHPGLWNDGGDHVINLMLQECGFDIWKECLHDARFKGLTTEQVYAILEREQPPPPPCSHCNGTGEGQDGGGKPCDKCGGSGQQAGGKRKGDPLTGRDILSPDEKFSDDEVKEIVSKAAAVAKAQGKLPANLEAMIKEATEPQYPVYRILEQFVDSNLRDEDASFHQPNRRYLPYGIIMPSPYSEKVEDVTVVFDTSGSVPDEDLSRFARITGDILRKLGPKLVRVIQCDARVHVVTEYRNLSDWQSGIKTTGRGGTDFRPPFEWLKERRFTPSCLVYLTDLQGSFPAHAPNYPVLWVATTDERAPFGLTVRLNQ